MPPAVIFSNGVALFKASQGNVAAIVCLGLFVWSLFCNAVLSILSRFAIILVRKTAEFITLLLTVSVLWLFFMVQWVGLQFVIVVFPGHTHLLFGISRESPGKPYLPEK